MLDTPNGPRVPYFMFFFYSRNKKYLSFKFYIVILVASIRDKPDFFKVFQND